MHLSELAARRLEQVTRGAAPDGSAAGSAPHPHDGQPAASASASNTAALQAQWTLAALRSLASTQLQDPDGAVLRTLTEPARLWPQAQWRSAEEWQLSIDALRSCHWLAIAQADRPWLAQLRQCWQAAPPVIGPWWPLRAFGEIALAAPHAVGSAWSDDDVEDLLEESMLRPSSACDRAWLALNAGLSADARQATLEYEALWAPAPAGCPQIGGPTHAEAEAEAELRRVLAHPAGVLRLQSRALWALVAVAESDRAGVAP